MIGPVHRPNSSPPPAPQPLPDPAATLLFDLDGTLTDSFAGIANSFRHCLSVVGAADPPDDLVRGIAGPPMLHSLQAMGLDEATAQLAFRAYRERYVEVGWLENSVFGGIEELLADLHAAGRTLAIATSKNEVTARRILDHFSLSDYFAVIAGASDDMTRAAKHEVIEHAIASVPGPYVMVGDRSHDIEGATKFDIPTVFVGWGFAMPGEASDATWAVDSVDELRRLLGA